MEKKAHRRAAAAEEALPGGDGREIDSKPLSEAEEKMRGVELQKESDLRLAMETFGVGVGASMLESMNPKSEEDFGQFKDALAGKIVKYAVSASGIGDC